MSLLQEGSKEWCALVVRKIGQKVAESLQASNQRLCESIDAQLGKKSVFRGRAGAHVRKSQRISRKQNVSFSCLELDSMDDGFNQDDTVFPMEDEPGHNLNAGANEGGEANPIPAAAAAAAVSLEESKDANDGDTHNWLIVACSDPEKMAIRYTGAPDTQGIEIEEEEEEEEEDAQDDMHQSTASQVGSKGLILDKRAVHDNCQMVQLNVCKQHVNGPCGYFAFHQALRVLLAASSTTFHMQAKHACILCVQNRIHLWSLYKQLQGTLLRRAWHDEEQYDKYPWGAGYIMSGDMERCHAKEILKRSPLLAASPFAGRISTLPELTVENLDELEQIFHNIRRAQDLSAPPEGYAHAFLCGVLNHWITIVCIAVPGKLEIVVADSRNEAMLNLMPEIIQANAEAKFGEGESWMKKIWMDSRSAARKTIDMIQECAMQGGATIHSFFVNRRMRNLIACWQEHVGGVPVPQLMAGDGVGSEKEAKSELDVAPDGRSDDMHMYHRMCTFLERRYPVPVLARSIGEVEQVGSHHMSESVAELVRAWIQVVPEQLTTVARVARQDNNSKISRLQYTWPALRHALGFTARLRRRQRRGACR